MSEALHRITALVAALEQGVVAALPPDDLLQTVQPTLLTALGDPVDLRLYYSEDQQPPRLALPQRDDSQTTPLPSDEAPVFDAQRNLWTIPLSCEQEQVGVIEAQLPRDADAAALRLVGWHVAQGLRSARFKQILQFEKQIAHELNAAATFTDLAAVIARHMLHSGEFATVNIFHYDEQRQHVIGFETVATANRRQAFETSARYLSPVDYERDIAPLLNEGHYLAIEDLARSTALSDKLKEWLAQFNILGVAIVPLRSRGQQAGFLGVNSTSGPLKITEARRKAFERLAEQVSGLVQAQTLLDTTAHQEDVSERQARAFRSLATGQDLAQMAHIIAQHMLPQQGRYLSINRIEYNLRGDVIGLHTLASANRDRSFTLDQIFPLNWEDVNGDVRGTLLGGEPYLVPDVVAVQPERIGVAFHNWMTNGGVRTMLNLPMMIEGRAVALLSVMSRDPATFSREEINAFTALADQVAALLHTRDLLERAQNARQVVDGLILASRLITTAEDYSDMVQAVLQTIAGHMTAAAIGLFDRVINVDRSDTAMPVSRTLVALGTADQPVETQASALEDDLPSPQQFEELRVGLPLIIANLGEANFPSAARRAQLAPLGAMWMASFGLRAAGQLLGTLDIFYHQPYQLGAEEIDAYVTLADQIGVTIRSRQLLEESRTAQALATRLVATNRMITESEGYGGMAQALTESVPSQVTVIGVALFDRAVTMFGLPNRLVLEGVATRKGSSEPKIADEFASAASKEDPRLTLVMRQLLEGQVWNVNTRAKRPPTMGQRIFEYLQEQGMDTAVVLGLIVNTRLLGLAIFGGLGELTLDKSQIDSLRAVTDQIAITLENRDLLRQTTETLGFVQSQYDSTSRIYRTDSPVDMLDVIYAFSGRTYDRAHIGMIDESGANVVILAETDEAGARALSFSAPLNEYPVGAGLSAMETLEIADVAKSRFLRKHEIERLQSNSVASMLILPLVINQRLIGLIGFTHSKPQQIASNRMRALRSMADQVAVKFQNQDLLRSTAESLEEVRTLYDANRSMLGAHDTLDMLRALRFNLAPDAAQIRHYSIGRIGNRVSTITLRHLLTRDGERITHDSMEDQMGESRMALFVKSWDSGQTRVVLVEDSQNSTEPIRALIDARSFVAILIREPGLFEEMIIVAYDQPRMFPNKTRRLYEAITDQIVIVLQRQQLLSESQISAAQLQSQVRVLQALNDLSNTITSAREEHVLLEQACQAMVNALGVDHSGIMLLDAEGRYGTVVAEHPSRGNVGTRLDVINDPLQRFTRENLQPLIVEDMETDPRVGEANRRVMLQAGIRSMLVVPVVDMQGQYIGSIGLDSMQHGGRYGADMVNVAQTITSQLAIGLQNIRLIAEARTRADLLESQVRALETLNEMAAIITSRRTEKKLFEDSAHALVSALGVDHCGILLLDSGGTIGTIAGEYPDTGLLGIELNMEQDTIHHQIRDHRMPVLVANTETQEGIDENTRDVWQRFNIKSVLVLPLIDANGVLIGSVGLDMYSVDTPITDDMTDVAQTIVSQIGVGLQNIRLLQEAERRAEQLQRITSFSQSVQATFDQESILQVAITESAHMIALTHLNVVFHDPNRDEVRVVGQLYRGKSEINLEDGPIVERQNTVIGKAWQERALVYIPDMRVEKELRHHNQELRSIMAVPIFSRGMVRGAVEIGFNRPGAYNETDQAVFQQMVTQMTVAMENANAYTQTQKLAQQRALTNDISAQLQRQSDMNRMLDITVNELGKALGAKKARIRLSLGVDDKKER